jgi:hypothetical protein
MQATTHYFVKRFFDKQALDFDRPSKIQKFKMTVPYTDYMDV